MEPAAFENLLLVSFELCKIVIFDPRHFILSTFSDEYYEELIIEDIIRDSSFTDMKHPRKNILRDLADCRSQTRLGSIWSVK